MINPINIGYGVDVYKYMRGLYGHAVLDEFLNYATLNI